MSDLQVMLTTNGVLLSVTADVKTSTGVQIITHYPVAMANLFRFWLLHRLQTLPLGSCFYDGMRSFGAFKEICFEQVARSHVGESVI